MSRNDGYGPYGSNGHGVASRVMGPCRLISGHSPGPDSRPVKVPMRCTGGPATNLWRAASRRLQLPASHRAGAGYRAGMALESVSEVVIETASHHPREMRTAAQLREVLATSDMSGLQWTSRVIVEHWAVPHSHPILTLNTRHEGDQLLATYIHEQMHWWTAEHPSFGQAVEDTRQEWSTVPAVGKGGADSEHSTRLHLIVCHLERRAVQRVVDVDRAATVLRRQMDDQVYPWVYGQIDSHQSMLDRICSDRDLWPARLVLEV